MGEPGTTHKSELPVDRPFPLDDDLKVRLQTGVYLVSPSLACLPTIPEPDRSPSSRPEARVPVTLVQAVPLVCVGFCKVL